MYLTPPSSSHLSNWCRKWVLVNINKQGSTQCRMVYGGNIYLNWGKISWLDVTFYKNVPSEVSRWDFKYCITIISAARTQWIKEKILMKSQLDAQQKPGIWQSKNFMSPTPGVQPGTLTADTKLSQTQFVKSGVRSPCQGAPSHKFEHSLAQVISQYGTCGTLTCASTTCLAEVESTNRQTDDATQRASPQLEPNN